MLKVTGGVLELMSPIHLSCTAGARVIIRVQESISASLWRSMHIMLSDIDIHFLIDAPTDFQVRARCDTLCNMERCIKPSIERWLQRPTICS